MKVFLRDKKISNGRKALYLDFYPPIAHPLTGKQTRREFLKLYLYERPKTEADRDHNKETKILADNIRAQRQIHLQACNYNFLLASHRKKDFLQYFRDLVDNRKSSKGNFDNWLSSFNYFKSFCKGRCLMEDVNETMVENFKTYLTTTSIIQRANARKKITPARSQAKKLSQNAAHSYYNKFRAAVRRAFEEKMLDEDPTKRTKGIKAGETEREFLTIEELNTLAKAECEIPQLKSMALVSSLTGLRWSDIIKLKWSQIQHSKENGYFIQFTQKKTKGVEVLYVSPQAIDLMGDRGKGDDLVFPDISYSAWLNMKIKMWVINAGITKKITFHSFRHTYATLQLTAGTDLYTVSKLLGHRSIRTTQIYAKVVDRKKIEAANKITLDI